MKGCIKVLKDQPPNSVEGLLNALRYVYVRVHMYRKKICKKMLQNANITKNMSMYVHVRNMKISFCIISNPAFKYWLQYFYNKESVGGATQMKKAVSFLCQRFWLSFF